MRSVDTNVVVRFLTDDEPRQAARARAVVAAGDLYLTLTVLLETEWVLRVTYGLARTKVIGLLRTFCGLPGIEVENGEVATTALDWADTGLEFADALHLAGSGSCAAFVSFDPALTRRAKGLSLVPVVEP